MKHTYHHAFTAPNLSCVFTFDPEAVVGAGAKVVDVKWSRDVLPEERPKVFAEYLAFKAQLMQDAADRSGKTMLDLVEVVPGRWVPFHYIPRQKRTQEL